MGCINCLLNSRFRTGSHAYTRFLGVCLNGVHERLAIDHGYMKRPISTSRRLAGALLAVGMFQNQAVHAKGAEDAGWTFGNGGADKCRLSSARVTMFDGYQETSIQLHVTPTGIHLQSKAPLDTGQADTGLQVEADAPEARALLRDAETDLVKFANFASIDLEALEAEIAAVEEERERVRGHKWFQDYARNPINAARLDGELAAAEQQLVPLREKWQGARSYLDAGQQKEAVLERLSRLPTFPLVLSSELEQRNKLHFTQARDELIDSFKRGAVVRVQLRFWPTWPETGTHETRLTLDGFNQVLPRFQACAGQG